MKISIIVAAAANNVIGREGGLPWHLPEDLRRFKELTLGKPLLMGRKTHESIGRALPGRQNIVLTRQPGYQAAGCHVVGSVDSALEIAKGADELMVIGGNAVYQMMLPRSGRIYLTRVHEAVEGDTVFPETDANHWQLVERQDFAANPDRPHAFSFLVLDRLQAA
jgi:dihydrofolate reductase